MKSKIASVTLLLALGGCRVPPAVPIPADIEASEKGSTAYLKTLTNEQRQSYDDQKAAYLKGLKDNPAGTKKEYAFYVLESQKTLGTLGYGTLFTGSVDRRTQDALSRYQKSKGIFQSGNVDVVTSFALSQDEMLLDKRIVTPGASSISRSFGMDTSPPTEHGTIRTRATTAYKPAILSATQSLAYVRSRTPF